MKPIKLSLVSFFLFATFTVFAQHPSVTFFGGGNASSVGIKIGDSSPADEDTYKTLFGLNVGALYDYVLNKDRRNEFSLESGLIFETKGYHQKKNQKISTDIWLDLNNKTTLYYVDIPLFFKYRYRFRSLNKIYFGVGPYVGLGLFGNESIDFHATDAITAESNSEKIEWGSNKDAEAYKRLDYGGVAKVGFLMHNGLNIAASYQHGFPNTFVESSNIVDTNQRKIKHRVFSLSIGYTLILDN